MPDFPRNSMLIAGTVLGDKYRIERVLGRGGMGLVVLAHHVELDQYFAIKLILDQYADNASIAERFLREARAAAKLHSEHVARVTDVGRWPDLGPYMIMEYLHGSDLDRVLRARGTLPVQEAVDYVLQAIDAIAEAHANGIVHRDLKPGNLFLAERPDGSTIVKVLDFGISKTTRPGAVDPKLTSSQAALGSPLFMAPEQFDNARNVEASADIWSLGVTLYQLVTGGLPFEGDGLYALFTNIATKPPIPMRERRPEVPKGLESVVRRCLELDPADRFEDVAELAGELAPFGSGGSARIVERAYALLGPDAPSPYSRTAHSAGNDSAEAPTDGRDAPPASYGAFTEEPTTLRASSGSRPSPRRRRARRKAALAKAGLAIGALASLGVIAVAVLLFGQRKPPVAVGVASSVSSPSAALATSPGAAAIAAPTVPPHDVAPPPPLTSAVPTSAAPTSAPASPGRGSGAAPAAAATRTVAPATPGSDPSSLSNTSNTSPVASVASSLSAATHAPAPQPPRGASGAQAPASPPAYDPSKLNLDSPQ